MLGLTTDIKETTDFSSKNGWVAPNGDFYACDGGYHATLGTWIAIFILNKDQSDLFHGKYFKQTFDSLIRSEGWACVKDTSWVDGNPNREILWAKETTEEQKKTIEKYLQKFLK